MRDFFIERSPSCEQWADGSSLGLKKCYETALAKLRLNPSNGTPVPGASDGRQTVVYPSDPIPGFPQVQIVYRVSGERVIVIACLEVLRPL
ncbi:MAG: hypothetical protein H7840_11525 [Alphaproteobacteria bacterium]